MKTLFIEIDDTPITETKQEHDTRMGDWLKQLRMDMQPNEPIEEIAAKLHISVDAILRCESGHDIPLYESTKLLEYYNTDEGHFVITRYTRD